MAGALTAMCAVGCLLYCFTVPPPPLPPAGLDLEDEDEEQPLLSVSLRYNNRQDYHLLCHDAWHVHLLILDLV